MIWNSFEEPFDDVIYPKGDPDAVSLSKRDVDLLQPDTFINDTIIDFYIQWVCALSLSLYMHVCISNYHSFVPCFC